MSNGQSNVNVSGLGKLVVIGLTVVVGFVALLMIGLPQYNIYRQRSSGAAKLAEAESSRQIAIAEAKAKEEAAKHLAQAEIERAKGVAEANRIIGTSLKDNEAYLWYLWIHNLESGDNDIIYVPTEGQLPVLEAGRFHKSFVGAKNPDRPSQLPLQQE